MLTNMLNRLMLSCSRSLKVHPLIYIHIWKSLGMLFIYSWGVFDYSHHHLLFLSFRLWFSHTDRIYTYSDSYVCGWRLFGRIYLLRAVWFLSFSTDTHWLLPFAISFSLNSYTRTRISNTHTLNLKSNWPSIYLTSCMNCLSLCVGCVWSFCWFRPDPVHSS